MQEILANPRKPQEILENSRKYQKNLENTILFKEVLENLRKSQKIILRTYALYKVFNRSDLMLSLYLLSTIFKISSNKRFFEKNFKSPFQHFLRVFLCGSFLATREILKCLFRYLKVSKNKIMVSIQFLSSWPYIFKQLRPLKSKKIIRKNTRKFVFPF